MKKGRRTGKLMRGLFVLGFVALCLVACASKTQRAQVKTAQGQQYLAQQSYTSALGTFTAAIEIDPTCVEAYIGRAQTYMNLEKYDKAIEDYRTVSRMTEDRPYTRATAYIGQAEAYEKENNEEKALADYEVAAALLKANDVGRAENISTEEVRRQLVKTLEAHAALCADEARYEDAAEDYSELIGLGEDLDEERDRMLSQASKAAR
jgi:tetratricopeptide (TPR) repeat protein